MTADQIGLWIGFVLTLMVFSYVLGDNALYRLAVYIFAGLTAGYLTVATLEGVILPWIRASLTSGEPGSLIVGFIPLGLGVLLLIKTGRRYSRLGNLALGFLIGVGAAVGVVGAISGTVLPLMSETVASLSVRPNDPDAAVKLVNGFILIVGVICTLVYMGHLGRRGRDGIVRRSALSRALGSVGQGFVVIALGALYGGAILTGLTILSERLAFIILRLGG